MTLSYNEAKERQRRAAQRSMQLLYRTRRDTAVVAYGGCCKVCGNADRTALQVVPRRGYRWGWENMGKPMRGGHEKMRWLEQNNYPDDFTVVCGPTFSQCRKDLQLLE